MQSYSISKNWYNEIKDIVPMNNVYFVTEGYYAGDVEVDVLDVELFNKVSAKLGWM